ncbi:zinc-binding dehydrogenase [Oceanobacillus oncorhynchi]|uniref:zinc-binding dehydrogenase n=1 Tax=Oceanobacillus oncorhynchi TaxID=545501 RepID=UPI0034D777D0
MQQAVLSSKEKVEFQEVPLPKIGEKEVLIKVENIGICGSDIHAYHGTHPFIDFPIVQGHEVSGVISKVNESVKKFAVGDRVAIRPQRVCGECRQCLDGRYNICESIDVLGCLSTGAASDYYSIEEELVYKLPDTVTLSEGTFIEPLSVAVHAIQRCGSVEGMNVLVLGSGTIGNLVAQSAKAMGAKKVITTDVSEFKLDLAQKCGVDAAVNIQTKDLENELLEKFGKDKADIIFDCVAVEPSINQAIKVARKGTNVVIVGVPSGSLQVSIDLIQDREINIIGTLCYTHEDYELSIQLIEEGKIELNRLITKTFDFEQFDEAYQYIEQKKDQTLKVIIHMND